jgi:large subunit ribosomal protein L21
MKAVIRTGGKQYFVSEGDKLEVEKLEGEPGEKVVFDDVLLITDDKGDKLELGNSILEKSKIEAEIVSQFKDKKVVVFKMKRRKDYRKKQGHRQQKTKVEIKKISV